MYIFYGTYNPSKVESMQKMLEGLDIDIIGLDCLDCKLTVAAEPGDEPLINAKIKAISYYQQLGLPVFSCDSGLYFEGVADEDQPGVLIRRINGIEMDYQEMLTYYSRLASKYGGKLVAHYRNAICLVLDENNIFFYDGEELNSEKFLIVDKPHEKYREGFPLDSISVDIQSGKYYYDLSEKDNGPDVRQGFRNFFIDNVINRIRHNNPDTHQENIIPPTMASD